MSNPNGQKGYRWEASVRDFLKALGYPIRRNTERGHADLGGLTHWAIECKDDANMTLTKMVEQADRQAANEGKPFGVVIKKIRRRPTGEAVAVLSLNTWLDVVRYVEALSGLEEGQQ